MVLFNPHVNEFDAGVLIRLLHHLLYELFDHGPNVIKRIEIKKYLRLFFLLLRHELLVLAHQEIHDFGVVHDDEAEPSAGQNQGLDLVPEVALQKSGCDRVEVLQRRHLQQVEEAVPEVHFLNLGSERSSAEPTELGLN